MSLIDKIVNKESVPIRPPVENIFTLDDVDILIRVIGSASFPVKDIESLYKAIYKLQELRIKLKQQYDATQNDFYNK